MKKGEVKANLCSVCTEMHLNVTPLHNLPCRICSVFLLISGTLLPCWDLMHVCRVVRFGTHSTHPQSSLRGITLCKVSIKT